MINKFLNINPDKKNRENNFPLITRAHFISSGKKRKNAATPNLSYQCASSWHPVPTLAGCQSEAHWHDKPARLTGKNINGFTLIEILIVIVIISVISAVAMLSIHFNRNKQLETLAHSLANLITLAEEEAMLRPAVLGLVFTSHSYQLYIYQENNHTWQPLPNRVFRSTAIPDDTQITLKIHGQDIPADGQHQLIISASGDIPDFTISIGKTDQAPLYQIIGKESGDVHVK